LWRRTNVPGQTRAERRPFVSDQANDPVKMMGKHCHAAAVKRVEHHFRQHVRAELSLDVRMNEHIHGTCETQLREAFGVTQETRQLAFVEKTLPLGFGRE
jgi:hypothetical protein